MRMKIYVLYSIITLAARFHPRSERKQAFCMFPFQIIFSLWESLCHSYTDSFNSHWLLFPPPTKLTCHFRPTQFMTLSCVESNKCVSAYFMIFTCNRLSWIK
jgi:hypothetical protein